MITISTKNLSYNARTKTFVGFISDLHQEIQHFPSSLVVKSHKTSVEKTFEFGDADQVDNDLVAYFYNCKNGDFSLTLYND